VPLLLDAVSSVIASPSVIASEVHRAPERLEAGR
jgi:hypothetical protein